MWFRSLYDSFQIFLFVQQQHKHVTKGWNKEFIICKQICLQSYDVSFPQASEYKANGKQWQISIREVMNTPYKSLESQKSMTNGDHFGYSTAFLLILLSLCIYLFFFFPTISSLFDITALSTWSLLEFSCLKYVTYAWILHPTVKLVPRGPSPSLTRGWSETVNLADMRIKVEMTLSRRLSKLVYLLNLIFMHL